jgi:glycosyltransferase involved in cell wall biosynthesis
VGGLENGLVNLINRLPRERYRHAIVCLTGHDDFAGRLTRREIPIIDLHKRSGHDLGLYFRLWKAFRVLQPDVVHTRNLSTLEAQLPAFFAGVRGRVHGEHGWDVFDLDGASRKYRWLRRAHRPLVQYYIPLSGHLERYLRATVGVQPERITRIVNGVDTERFRPTVGTLALDPAASDTTPVGTASGPERLTSRPSPVGAASGAEGLTPRPCPVGTASGPEGLTLRPSPVGAASGRDEPAPRGRTLRDLGAPAPFVDGLRGDAVLIGTVGRMEAVKDPLNLVRAFLTLLERRPERRATLRLVMVGGGTLYEQVRAELRTAGVEDLAWLPGSRDDTPALYRAMDVFVLPSLAEGISNTILEAMASGLPVVATDVGGNAELVEEGSTGFLVPRAGPAALAAAIERYLESPDLRRAHGEAGRQHAEHEFSMDRMVQQYMDVYDTVLRERGRDEPQRAQRTQRASRV